MTGSNNFLSFTVAPKLFLSSWLIWVLVTVTALGKRNFSFLRGFVSSLQRLFQENKIKKWQLIALWWLLITCPSDELPSAVTPDKRWHKADFTRWWHFSCWRDFLFIPAENNHQGSYLYGMLWIWGFILCKSTSKLPLIPVEAGARFYSSILEMVIYILAEKKIKSN